MYTLFLLFLAGACLGIAHGASEAVPDQIGGISLGYLMMGLIPVIALIMTMFTSRGDTSKMDQLAFFGVPAVLFGTPVGSVVYQSSLRLIFSNFLLLAGVANLVTLVLIALAFYSALEPKPKKDTPSGSVTKRRWLHRFRIPLPMMSLIVSGVFLGISTHFFLDTVWVVVSAAMAGLGALLLGILFLFFVVGFFRGFKRKNQDRLHDTGVWLAIFFANAAGSPIISELLVRPFWPWAFARPGLTLGYAIFFGLLFAVLMWREYRRYQKESWG